MSRPLLSHSEVSSYGSISSSPASSIDERLALDSQDGSRTPAQSRWPLFIGLAVFAWIYSLDSVTTWIYGSFATSDFKEHSLLGAVSVIGYIVISVGKPVAATFADNFGRANAWTLAVLVYTLGYIGLSLCGSIKGYAISTVLRATGFTSVQILMQIIIGDFTTLRWRSLMSGAVSTPYLVNSFIGSSIAADVIEKSSWRYGYAMFAVLIPLGAIPVIGTLYWRERSAKLHRRRRDSVFVREELKRMNVQHKPVHPAKERKKSDQKKLDMIGLFLFTLACSMILLPFSVASKASALWSTPSILTLLGGVMALFAFAYYEQYHAENPFMPLHFIRNRTVLCAALIGMLDFTSFSLQYAYQYSFIYVVKDWTTMQLNLFGQIQTLTMTLFALITGFAVAKSRRYKRVLVVGLCIRLLGVGLMIHSKGAHGRPLELVLVQALQGIGGGIASALGQTAAQATVSRSSMASVTALVLLSAEFGGAVGTSVAAAVWRNVMPGSLKRELSGLADEETVKRIYESIVDAAKYEMDDPIRMGTIRAYDYTMAILLITATIIAAIPPLLALKMEDLRLGDYHNVIEGGDGLPVTALSQNSEAGPRDPHRTASSSTRESRIRSV